MLNIPITWVETVIFIIFLGVWASLLFGGFIFGELNQDETSRMPVVTRLLSSFALVTAGWTWFAIVQGTPIDQLAAWIAIGMTLGFMGDIFMAQVLSVQSYVLYGIGAFGLGHIAYIIGMSMIALPTPIMIVPALMIMLFWWMIAGILWYLVVYRNSKPNLVIYLALPYATLLATTVGIAMNLTFVDQSFAFIIVGALLFLISDLVLAAQLFNGLHFKYISDIVWLLYGPGQMLIVYGVFLYTIIDS